MTGMTHIDQTMRDGGYEWHEGVNCWIRPIDSGTEVFRVYGLVMYGGAEQIERNVIHIRATFPDMIPSAQTPVAVSPSLPSLNAREQAATTNRSTKETE